MRAAVSTAVILRNFSNMTRLPRVLFGANQHLDWLSTNSDVKPRHKLKQILSNWRSPYTRSGESEDRRDTRLGVTTFHPKDCDC